MASKVTQAKFNKKVGDLILSLGGIDITKETRPPGYKNWSLQTKAGLLDITVHEPEASKIFSIFCRFDDVEKAKSVLSPLNAENLNPFSGKWNYHYSSEQDCLQIFESSLREIL